MSNSCSNSELSGTVFLLHKTHAPVTFSWNSLLHFYFPWITAFCIFQNLKDIVCRACYLCNQYTKNFYTCPAVEGREEFLQRVIVQSERENMSMQVSFFVCCCCCYYCYYLKKMLFRPFEQRKWRWTSVSSTLCPAHWRNRLRLRSGSRKTVIWEKSNAETSSSIYYDTYETISETMVGNCRLNVRSNRSSPSRQKIKIIILEI